MICILDASPCASFPDPSACDTLPAQCAPPDIANVAIVELDDELLSLAAGGRSWSAGGKTGDVIITG